MRKIIILMAVLLAFGCTKKKEAERPGSPAPLETDVVQRAAWPPPEIVVSTEPVFGIPQAVPSGVALQMPVEAGVSSAAVPSREEGPGVTLDAFGVKFVLGKAAPGLKERHECYEVRNQTYSGIPVSKCKAGKNPIELVFDKNGRLIHLAFGIYESDPVLYKQSVKFNDRVLGPEISGEDGGADCPYRSGTHMANGVRVGEYSTNGCYEQEPNPSRAYSVD